MPGAVKARPDGAHLNGARLHSGIELEGQEFAVNSVLVLALTGFPEQVNDTSSCTSMPKP